MVEKVTRDVLDLAIRAIEAGFLVDGTSEACSGASFGIEGVPIGLITPCDGRFVDLDTDNDLTVGGDLQVTGTITASGADMDMGMFRITNMHDPVDPQDAITLSYADSRYINAATDSMGGPLYLSGEPTASNEASTKSYADKALRPDSVSVGTPTAPKYYFSTNGPSGGTDGDVWFQFA